MRIAGVERIGERAGREGFVETLPTVDETRGYLIRQFETAWKLTSIHLNGLATEECLWRPAQQGLHVPLDDMGIVESIHLTAFHWVVDDLHRRLA